MAGFGRRINWDPKEDKVPEGRQMSFSNALRTVSKNLIFRALIPTWANNLTKKTRDVTTAFSEFGAYLTNMVGLGRKSSEITSEQLQDGHQTQLAPDSLFNILLSANDENMEDEKKGLDDREVAGNIFLFLFAGHETTAHTLSFCLGLLALYPETQQEVYVQIEQFMKLHGSVARNGSSANEDIREDFFIPEGANVWLSITAVHYNPAYWPEPEKFRPKRFLEPYNKDAFLAFSTGPRSCIGRRFAEIEGIVALAMLIERYEIKIDEEKFLSVPGESALVSSSLRVQILSSYGAFTCQGTRGASIEANARSHYCTNQGSSALLGALCVFSTFDILLSEHHRLVGYIKAPAPYRGQSFMQQGNSEGNFDFEAP
ncbi:cytochrome P450 [Rhizoctonia solani AG-1 IA]|uniref:Cytochrome P450 n=1 Tax=Thanatephorus cucumeris (strain AG1-IA) TaxID=983506 RepID=L8WU38_THACA|nr:cytochrome P450 [Rhizoctonia solani AG-1 IA]